MFCCRKSLVTRKMSFLVLIPTGDEGCSVSTARYSMSVVLGLFYSGSLSLIYTCPTKYSIQTVRNEKFSNTWSRQLLYIEISTLVCHLKSSINQFSITIKFSLLQYFPPLISFFQQIRYEFKYWEPTKWIVASLSGT